MKYKNIFLLGVLLSGVMSFVSAHAAHHESTRLLRFPDIHKKHVTFVYGGDIYLASASGGLATKLTSDDGLELFPKFSPDGKKIAFSAEYSGNRQVYVMNADGSGLKQLTYYNDVGKMPPRGGFDYRVLDWTPDAKHILVRANRLPWGPRMGRPMLVPADGGMPKEMAVPEGGGGMLSPDGENLLYTPIDREWRTWKRHRGGRAQDVWIYNLANNSSEQLTTNRATDQQPVWVGDNIYFASDRAYTLNLYRYQKDAEPVQQTFHKEFDVLWPSAGPDAVVYQNGGYLHRFDPAAGKSEKIEIKVAGARPHRQPSFKNVAAYTDSFDLSHDGKRALFASRGELFTVPEKSGPTRNISNSIKAREISASWSPDGKNIVFLSDATGEYEVYTRPQNGKGKAKQLTKNSSIWLFPPVWAGSSDKIAWADKNQTLWIVGLNGKATEVDRAQFDDIEEYQFSADGRYLSYVKQAKNGLEQIWLYDSKVKTKVRLSDNTTSDFSPVFDPKGRYLYFLSNRDYNLNFASYEFDYLYHNATRIYAAPLNDSVTMPSELKSDEVGLVKENDDKDEKTKSTKPITLNVKKMRDYSVALSATAGDYQQLSANDDGVLVLAGNGGNSKLTLVTVGKDAKTEVIASKINDYRLAAGGKKVLVKQGDKFSIIDAKAKQKPSKNRLVLKDLQMRIDPSIEWAQMYKEAWRTLRDWFYDPNMHGQDWQKIYDKYQPLVAHVAHRSDLDFILSEVAGEMNSGHIYVQNGDEPSVKRIEGGLLGAEIVPHASGNFQIEKIFKGENWHEGFRSPLTQVGVNVQEGEFILAVNGVASNSVKNFYQLMENTASKTITLTVASKANGKSLRDVLVKPIKRETNLRYLDWAMSRAAYVEQLSNGRIGYIHLPNTAIEGNRELFKQLLPQINKEALIIDDRYNGGGFIPEHMIAMLSREPLNYWKRRGSEPVTTPFYQHTGPKAMLVNGYSSSGGDALPYYFRKNKLGKIIGTRTWGGLIGISGNPRLVDGGQVLASTFRFLGTDGKWAVENEGVSPDIEVLDRPELMYQGKDPSIERAVSELLKELPERRTPSMKAPAAPTQF